ncbi:ABC transporter permease [Microbacterium sp. F2E]|uniref:ABC transporter permease n=1 Tax=Microbacterium sp. F2E TaxID=2895284 RepID=UPI001E648B46|nr:ABC transporter permease [Microbacterium sp. F2E]MCC9053524.1 ABC transporter permease [Microbacterium sp. F2E]
MIAIARAETRMLLRNRLVAATAILVPVVFAATLILTQDNFGGSSIVAALLTIVIAALGVYITATTTLAARRQTLFLKRLRSTTVTDASILTGLLTPIVLINLIQLTIILTVLAFTGSAPQNIPMLIAGVLAVEGLFIGLALCTAGVTNSPEHAQVTTLPVFFLAFGVAFWIALTGTEEFALIKRLLPGGAAAELLIDAWNGTDTGAAIITLLPTLAWVLVTFVVSTQIFRWEPRR